MMHSLYLFLGGSLVWPSFGIHVGINDKDQVPLAGAQPTIKILVARHGYTCGDAFTEFASLKHQYVTASKYSWGQQITGVANPNGKNDVLTAIGSQEMRTLKAENDGRQDVKIVFSSGLATAIESAAVMFPNAEIMPIPVLGNLSFEFDPAVGKEVHARLGPEGQMFKVNYQWDNVLRSAPSKYRPNDWDSFLGFLTDMYFPNAADFEDGTIGVMTHADVMNQPDFASCNKKASYIDHKGEHTQGWTPKANSMVLLSYKVTNKAVEDSFDVTPKYMLDLQKEFQDTTERRKSCIIVHAGFSLSESMEAWKHERAGSMDSFPLCEADFDGCPEGMPKHDIPTVESQYRESAGLVSDLEEKLSAKVAYRKTIQEKYDAAKGWNDLNKRETAWNYLGWATNKVTGRSPLRTKEDQDKLKDAHELDIEAHEQKLEQVRARIHKLRDAMCYVAGKRPQNEEEAIIDPAGGADSDVVDGGLAGRPAYQPGPAGGEDEEDSLSQQELPIANSPVAEEGE